MKEYDAFLDHITEFKKLGFDIDDITTSNEEDKKFEKFYHNENNEKFK